MENIRITDTENQDIVSFNLVEGGDKVDITVNNMKDIVKITVDDDYENVNVNIAGFYGLDIIGEFSSPDELIAAGANVGDAFFIKDEINYWGAIKGTLKKVLSEDLI